MDIDIIEYSKKHNYKVGLSGDKKLKLFTSPNANYTFDLESGKMYSWGHKLSEDPVRFPAPNIADIEIDEQCTGVLNDNRTCQFCFPEGTKISLASGCEKNIEDIVAGENIISFDLEKNQNSINEVKEVYKRPYNDILITLELEDGSCVTLTPNHPVFVKNKGWVEAQNLTENDDLVLLAEVIN